MMDHKGMRSVLLLLFAFFLFIQGAAAAEGKKAVRPAGKYKQVTGEVISISKDNIVIKNKTKGTMTLAITKNTDMIGTPVKAGDKARVNYRQEENGYTATRIAPKKAAARSGKQHAAAIAAGSAAAQ